MSENELDIMEYNMGISYKNIARRLIGIPSSQRCWNCGSYNSNLSRDHLIPKAVYKLYSEMDSTIAASMRVKIVNNRQNLLLSCKKCNATKGASVTTPEQLNKPWINGSFVEEYRALYSSCKEYIDTFNSFRDEVLSKSGNRCWCCGNTVYNDWSPRRLNEDNGYDIDNVVAVCNSCNRMCNNENQITKTIHEIKAIKSQS